MNIIRKLPRSPFRFYDEYCEIHITLYSFIARVCARVLDRSVLAADPDDVSKLLKFVRNGSMNRRRSRPA